MSYDWTEIESLPSHEYLTPLVRRWLLALKPQAALDLGSGDGRLTDVLRQDGIPIQGLDFSPSGVERARQRYPETSFRVHDLGTPLATEFRGRFDAITAIEVIEHMLLPRELFKRADEGLTPNGRLIVTTPYHGYWKNLALAVSGKMESHFTVGLDYGHIKFFSAKSLSEMAGECGFRREQFARVGRIPALAASMALCFTRK